MPPFARFVVCLRLGRCAGVTGLGEAPEDEGGGLLAAPDLAAERGPLPVGAPLPDRVAAHLGRGPEGQGVDAAVGAAAGDVDRQGRGGAGLPPPVLGHASVLAAHRPSLDGGDAIAAVTRALRSRTAWSAVAVRRAAAVLPYLDAARRAGATTLQKLSDALTARGVRTPRGGEGWRPWPVQRVLNRMRT